MRNRFRDCVLAAYREHIAPFVAFATQGLLEAAREMAALVLRRYREWSYRCKRSLFKEVA